MELTDRVLAQLMALSKHLCSFPSHGNGQGGVGAQGMTTLHPILADVDEKRDGALCRNANSEPLELVVADDDLAFGRGFKVPNQVRRDGLNRL